MKLTFALAFLLAVAAASAQLSTPVPGAAAAISGVNNAASALTSLIPGLDLSGLISNVLSIVDGLLSSLTSALNGLTSVLAPVTSIAGKVGPIANQITGVLTSAVSQLGDILNNIVSRVQALSDAELKVLQGLVQEVLSLVKNLVSGILQCITNVANNLEGAVANTTQKAAPAVAQLPAPSASGGISAALNGLLAPVSSPIHRSYSFILIALLSVSSITGYRSVDPSRFTCHWSPRRSDWRRK